MDSDRFEWRLFFALVLLMLGMVGLGSLGLVWCYAASYLGGHAGFMLQVGSGLCLTLSGFLLAGERE